MALKRLARFNIFDVSFFNKLKLLYTGYDFIFDENKQIIGIKYKVLIAEDRTEYGEDKNTGEVLVGLNEGELLNVKVLNSTVAPTIERLAIVKLVNPVGKIYGEFSNNLSLTADNVVAIDSKNRGE